MSSSPASSYTLFDHLLELRSRLLNVVLGVLIVFFCLFYFANDIYEYVSKPLMENLPESGPPE